MHSKYRDFVSRARFWAELVNGNEVTEAQIVCCHPVVTSKADRAIFERVHSETPGLLDHFLYGAFGKTCGRDQHIRSLGFD
jgi:hypothetical protein